LSGLDPSFDPRIDRHLRETRPALVPEIRTREARALVPLWEDLEASAGSASEPPFWAYSWPGSQALARHVLDRPETVRGRRVLDVGAGNGLASVACALAGAARVVANDVDPRAAVMVAATAAANGVEVDVDIRDRLDDDPASLAFDVVFLGDLFYARALAARAARFARGARAAGIEVWIGEPGRDYALADGVEELARYRVPVSREIESRDAVEARVLRVLAGALH